MNRDLKIKEEVIKIVNNKENKLCHHHLCNIINKYYKDDEIKKLEKKLSYGFKLDDILYVICEQLSDSQIIKLFEKANLQKIFNSIERIQIELYEYIEMALESGFDL